MRNGDKVEAIVMGGTDEVLKVEGVLQIANDGEKKVKITSFQQSICDYSGPLEKMSTPLYLSTFLNEIHNISKELHFDKLGLNRSFEVSTSFKYSTNGED